MLKGCRRISEDGSAFFHCFIPRFIGRIVSVPMVRLKGHFSSVKLGVAQVSGDPQDEQSPKGPRRVFLFFGG